MSLHDYVGEMQNWTESTNENFKAFVHYRRDIIDLQVERLNDLKNTGAQLPSLYGVPIAIKDNIDTEDYPTELGFAGAVGRTPRMDAYLVHKLRAAGALIWAKSATTEFAYLQPCETLNPRVPGHTPGGSSSGSAAAVASGMVPVSIGTQTNGSVIRPASFCGVYGYKPSRGLIFVGGVLNGSPSLDQIGLFARSVSDLASVAEVMIGGHENAAGSTIYPMALKSVSDMQPPLQPKLMFAKTPMWDQMDPRSQTAFLALIEELKDCMVDMPLPESVGNAVGWLRTVMDAEMSVNLQPLIEGGSATPSAPTLELIERGEAITATEYLKASKRLAGASAGFAEYFDYFDAIVTPATLGPAPEGFASTGNPVMSSIWTFAGLPCISLPLLQTEDGLPIGIQLVGALNNDGRLLRTARWLETRLNGATA
mgnify:CR=1 FL=1